MYNLLTTPNCEDFWLCIYLIIVFSFSLQRLEKCSPLVYILIFLYKTFFFVQCGPFVG